MAVARQTQSNTMLYTVVTFVALFLIAAVCGVIFYLKSEDWRNLYQQSQTEMSELATSAEIRGAANIIGAKVNRQSRISQMLGYIDQLYMANIGVVPAETTAEVKVEQILAKYADAVAAVPESIEYVGDANGPGALTLLDMYNSKLQQTEMFLQQKDKQLENLQQQFTVAKQGAAEREQELRDLLSAEQEKTDSVQASYNQLKELMNKKADEQVQILSVQRDEAIEEKNSTRQELLAAMSKLNITQTRLKDALSRLEILKPRPKEDIAAYQPDGHIISIDNSSNIVFIDLGSDSKVYAGLTFSVYDRSAPVPTDGSGKAEIEVFDVDKHTAIARINKSSKRNPIVEGDAIINLIWDSKDINRFVVAGSFDFNSDDVIDADGAEKIKQLIENWDGVVENTVTIDTDFVVLGSAPSVLRKPSIDEMEIDPMAMDKYEKSLAEAQRYQDVKQQSKDLYIPVFGMKRFFNFIGYESVATKK